MRWFKRGVGVLLCTYLLALIFMVMPMPGSFDAYRPDWLAIVMLYWVIALPHRVNIGTAWLLGLLADVLLGSTLGIHAAAMAIMVYFAARHFQKIRNFSLSQQMLIVLILVLLKRALVFEIEHFINNAPFVWSYFLPALTSAIIWPWLFLLLRKLRRQFGVS
ncbi:rod shape-determining protein MreD [Idiomarina xiamenensis]|uniref:Rod shape-determining protein MreD n=1 Tax=Idiomarina xiamenensis 10-D-4 TaxID=740709 RepID=K2KF66_9GAMM|nr:rod shape-determining protein MreD [Idiomarina xiamenensis]EKE85392.1 rod shape-determining protein [Idiomarina xiamenensis 10-D-4]